MTGSTARAAGLAGLALVAISLGGCCGGGSVAAEQALAGDGTFEWEVVVPDGNQRTLWLQYQIDCPAEDGDDGLEPDYDVEGRMRLSAGGEERYEGYLALSSSRAPLEDGGNTSTKVSTKQSCSSGGCSLTGRTKVMDLATYGPGTHLRLEGQLPMNDNGVTVHAASLQIRAK